MEKKISTNVEILCKGLPSNRRINLSWINWVP
jgi:hypothetical protein